MAEGAARRAAGSPATRRPRGRRGNRTVSESPERRQAGLEGLHYYCPEATADSQSFTAKASRLPPPPASISRDRRDRYCAGICVVNIHQHPSWTMTVTTILAVVWMSLPLSAQRAGVVVAAGTRGSNRRGPSGRPRRAEGRRTALQSTTTNQNGEFQFPGVAAGRYDVAATFEGFQPTTTRVMVGNRAPSAVRILMPLAAHHAGSHGRQRPGRRAGRRDLESRFVHRGPARAREPSDLQRRRRRHHVALP